MRLGALEKRVLAAILESRDAPEVKRVSAEVELDEIKELNAQKRAQLEAFTRQVGFTSRTPQDAGVVAAVKVRGRLWGSVVTPAQRAGLSRALRTLRAKGLIRKRGGTTRRVELTQEGEKAAQSLNVNFVEKASMLTSQEAAA